MFPKTGRCMVFAFLVAATARVASAQGITSQDKLQDTLMVQETKLLYAIESKDRAALAELLHDQVMSVSVERGRRMTAEHIADLASVSFTDVEMSDAKTIRVTPDVAILSFKLSWTANDGHEQPATTTVYATAVWKQVDGQWRSVFYQETPAVK
jgi:uncharacterized protein (TIGR02246 family)